MNCSAISLARTATNGCGAVMKNSGAFLSATSNTTTSTAAAVAMAPIPTSTALNGATGKALLAMANGGSSALQGAASVVSSSVVSKKPELAAKIIQQSNIVCFDVDSTVICEEGIDELADFCGKGDEVARVTKEAMGGAMTFQDALSIRLNIIRPTQRQIADFVKRRPSTLTRNIKRFVEQLRADGKCVYLISGGFDCLIEPVARELGIPLTQLYANRLMFAYNGDYESFDATQPTSKSGGKAEAIAIIKRQHPDALVTMIGDGATDLEAVPPADYFIGFGGNVVRAEVYKRAQYYVTDFAQLM